MLAVLFAALLIWINGPGIRWLGPKLAAHFMEKAGIRGTLAIDGSLTGGISVRDVSLTSDGPLERLTLRKLAPIYRIPDLIDGRFGGLVVDGLHADVRLQPSPESEPEETGEKEPVDFRKIAATLSRVREKVLPLDLRLTDLSVRASKDGKPFLALAPSRIEHRPGDPAVRIGLGEITDATGRVWPAQQSTLTWQPEEITLDRLDPLPGLGVSDLVVRLPLSDDPSAELSLRLDDALLFVSASQGFKSLGIDLREGSVLLSRVAGRFGIELPADAAVTSLAVNADGLLPDPLAATGDVRLLLENVVSGEWTVPELSLDLGLDKAAARVAANGNALGTGFSLNAETPITRNNGTFAPGETRGTFNVADVSRLTASLADKVKAIDPEKPLLPSTLDGSFRLGMDANKPASASAELALKPADPKQAAALVVRADWKPGAPLAARVTTEGLAADAGYDIDAATYQGSVAFDGFTTARIDKWLESFRVVPGMTATLTGAWKGGGAVKDSTHHGALDLTNLEISRPDMPPVKALGGIDYQWPSTVGTRNLKVETGGQSVAADLSLAGEWLELRNLLWQDKGREMLTGSARLPVPEDFAQWRSLLSDDKRPLAVSIESKVLSLASLKDWAPAAARFDPRSTGRISIKAAGTFAKPDIATRVELRELRSPEQPKLPPADLTLDLSGKDGRLALRGEALAPDFAPAVINASMAFRPAVWAENPETVRDEGVTARVDLPRLDISRFSSLVAAAESLRGVVTGNVEVGGTLGKPAVKGRIDLTNAALTLKDRSMPPITGIGAGVEATLDRVTLRDFRAAMAGGTLQAGGSLDLREGKPAALDFRVTGRHLPAKRDDSLIVRANADLRLSGPWETAALTGTVGVVDSLFYRDIELLPIGTPFTTPSAASLPKLDAPSTKPTASLPEPFRNWRIDVRARTEDPFLIRGNFASGRVDVNLRVGGTMGNPQPDGEVKISSLRAALPFSTLQVKSGIVRFDASTGLDPVLEIRGTAEPRPYRVSLYVYGRASNPQLVLTSSPPLPENEIMTLLATGTTTSGLEDPAAAQSRAMQLLAEEVRRGRFAVGKQLRPLLGLIDRVDFTLNEADPYTSEKYSTATLQVTDRWYLSAGMGAEGNTRVLGIWRLSFR